MEEVILGFVSREPRPMKQEAVNLIGEYKFLVFDAVFAQLTRERHSLLEGHVAIIVALNQKHG